MKKTLKNTKPPEFQPGIEWTVIKTIRLSAKEVQLPGETLLETRDYIIRNMYRQGLVAPKGSDYAKVLADFHKKGGYKPADIIDNSKAANQMADKVEKESQEKADEVASGNTDAAEVDVEKRFTRQGKKIIVDAGTENERTFYKEERAIAYANGGLED